MKDQSLKSATTARGKGGRLVQQQLQAGCPQVCSSVSLEMVTVRSLHSTASSSCCAAPVFPSLTARAGGGTAVVGAWRFPRPPQIPPRSIWPAMLKSKRTPIPDSFTSLRSSKVIASPLPPHSSHSWQRTRGGLSCAALCALRISSMVLEVPLDFLHWQCVVRGLLQSYGECSLVGPFGMKWKNYFALEISVYL